MKYTIFSIDDSRMDYIAKIANTLTGWQSFDNENVNGSIDSVLQSNMEKHGYRINFPEWKTPKVGHLGIWYSVLNSFDHGPHVTFEDDALLGEMFLYNFNKAMREIPEDTDFFSLFLPRDSDHMWNQSMSVSKRLTRTYQRYGGVSMYYTERGTENIKSLLERDGITGQYDDTLYAYAKAGELNGYCQKPTLPDLVYITGEEDSIVQESKPFEGITTV